MLRSSCAALLLAWLAFGLAPIDAQSPPDGDDERIDAWIYWGRPGELGRLRADGSQQEILLRASARISALVFDATGQTLYLGDAGRSTVEALAVDAPEQRRSVLEYGRGITDLERHGDTLFVASNQLLQVDLTTGDHRPVLDTGYGMPRQLAVGGGWIFWSTARERIERARLDGTDHDDEFLWAKAQESALHVVDDHLFVLETDGHLWRTTLDGDDKTLLNPPGDSWAGALTHHQGRLYWVTCQDAYSDGPCTIRTLSVDADKNGDGNDAKSFVFRQHANRITALGSDGQSLHWAERRAVMRHAGDGKAPHTVVPEGRVDPTALAGRGERLYRWNGHRSRHQQLISSRLDGGGEVLIDDRFAESLALDGDHLLWVERQVTPSKSLFGNSIVSTLHRADLQGGSEIQLTSLSDALQDVQVRDGWMFWIRGMEVERRSTQPETEVHTVVSGDRSRQDMLRLLQGGAAQGDAPDCIASDDGWIFWADRNQQKIVRMRQDGTRRGDVLSGLDYVNDMTAGDGYIVWTSDNALYRTDHQGGGRIQLGRDLDVPDDLAIHDGRLYFSQLHTVDGELQPSISRLALAGGDVEVLLQGDGVLGPGTTLSRRQREVVSPTITALTASAEGLVWAEGATQRILHAALDGTGRRPLDLNDKLNVGSLAAADGIFYAADHSRRLWRLDIDFPSSLPETPLATTATVIRRLPQDAMKELSIDGEYLVWTTSLTPNLVRYHLGRGAETMLLEPLASTPQAVEMPKSIRYLATDDTWVYLVDGLSGSIERIRHDGTDMQPWVDKLARGIVSGLQRLGDSLLWLDVDGLWIAEMDRPQERRHLLHRRDIKTFTVVLPEDGR